MKSVVLARSVSGRRAFWLGLGLVVACDRYRPTEPAGTAGTGGGAGSSTAGSGGAGSGGESGAGLGGSSGEAGTTQTTGGTAGTGGTGQQQPPAPEECPDDGTDTAQLTLAGLGFGSSVTDTDAGLLVDAGALVDGGDAGTAPDADGGLPDAADSVLLPGLVGWASVAGQGSTSTIGGAAGRVVTARTAAELQEYASSSEPLVIRVCGTIRAPSVQVTSNKTLVGVGTQATLEGGLRIRGTSDINVRDVVVKNLRVNGAYSAVDGAAIQVYNAHHVWIDHSEVWDSIDGLIQVVHGSDFVTVSWTKFHFTQETPDKEHRFACLIGHDDLNVAEDEDHLRVTMHHNWWADYIRQRAPRVRFGDVHLFNNYWSSAGNDYSIWAAMGSRLLIEQNHFEGVTNPHELHDPDAQILTAGNIYEDTSGIIASTSTAFTPPYIYEAQPAAQVAAAVTAGAGRE
jgi:pectate lyase